MTAVAILIMWLIGFGLACLFYPGQPLRKNIVIKACLGYGAGAGLTSILYFANLAGEVGLQEYAYIIEPVLAVVLLGAAVIVARRTKSANAGSLTETAPSATGESIAPAGRSLKWLFVLLALSVAAMAVYRCYLLINADPHGRWDAWAIWNLHARFICEGREYWKDMFLNSYSHPDYPLLLPASVARVWNYACDRSTAAPITIGLGFSVCSVLLIFCAVRSVCGLAGAAVAAAIVMSAPGFVSQSVWQYADLPLSYFILCAAVVVVQAQTDRKPSRFLLAGLMLGFACWTKNEGLLCLPVFLAVLLICGLALRQGWSSVKHVLLTGAGALPGVAATTVFKLAFAPSNDIMAGLGSGQLAAKISDPQRYLMIFDYFGRELGNQEMWGMVGCAVVFLVLLAAFGFRKSPAGTRPTWVVVFSLTLIVAGYFTVYVVTPRELKWHLDTSLNRVFLHVWPAAIFAVFYLGSFAEISPARAELQNKQ